MCAWLILSDRRPRSAKRMLVSFSATKRRASKARECRSWRRFGDHAPSAEVERLGIEPRNTLRLRASSGFLCVLLSAPTLADSPARLPERPHRSSSTAAAARSHGSPGRVLQRKCDRMGTWLPLRAVGHLFALTRYGFGPSQTFMRSNSIYIGVVIAGAFAGEKVGRRSGGREQAVVASMTRTVAASVAETLVLPFVDIPCAVQAVHAIGDGLWESNNQGKLWKHMQVRTSRRCACAEHGCSVCHIAALLHTSADAFRLTTSICNRLFAGGGKQGLKKPLSPCLVCYIVDFAAVTSFRSTALVEQQELMRAQLQPSLTQE